MGNNILETLNTKLESSATTIKNALSANDTTNINAALEDFLDNYSGSGAITEDDNGKVVVDGVLTMQTAHEKVTQNKVTIDTTVNNSVEIDVLSGDYNREILISNASLSDIVLPAVDDGTIGFMNFIVTLMGTPLPIVVPIKIDRANETTFYLYGGAYDAAGSQGAAMSFSYTPEIAGLTCHYLAMIANNGTLTDLTSTASDMISNIYIGVYTYINEGV